MSNPNRLSATWSKKQKDILYRFPRKVDGGMLNMAFSHPIWNSFLTKPHEWSRVGLLEELEKRGYDLRTLRFQIDMREPGEPLSGLFGST